MTDVEVSGTELETLSQTPPSANLSSVLVESVYENGPWLDIRQVLVEIVAPNTEIVVPDVYPNLAGITWTFLRSPVFNTGKFQATSGREVRVGYYSAPLWKWTLKYSYLPDFQGNGSTSSDYKTLVGFFASHFGSLMGFYFQDPDDNTVTGATTGVGDGSNRQFSLIRFYGASGYETQERIGGLNQTQDFNVYVGGVLQTPITDYTIHTDVPGNQYIMMTSAPADGAIVSVDMSYYFYCRFENDELEFTQFMKNWWENEEVVIVSLRG